MIVLNKSMITLILLKLDGSGEDYAIEIQMDLYAKEIHGKKALDEALSQLMATFIANLSTLRDDESIVTQDDFWEVSNNATFEDNNQVLNTVSAVVRFKYK